MAAQRVKGAVRVTAAERIRRKPVFPFLAVKGDRVRGIFNDPVRAIYGVAITLARNIAGAPLPWARDADSSARRQFPSLRAAPLYPLRRAGHGINTRTAAISVATATTAKLKAAPPGR